MAKLDGSKISRTTIANNQTGCQPMGLEKAYSFQHTRPYKLIPLMGRRDQQCHTSV